jgi:ActR/RegA family two-component response regulator
LPLTEFVGSETRALIIDDDKIFCELLAETLASVGIKAVKSQFSCKSPRRWTSSSSTYQAATS